MRQLVHKLSNFEYFKKINKSGIFLFLILFLIFIQFLIFNPTETNMPMAELKTAEQIQNLANIQKNKKTVEQKATGVHYLEISNKIKGWEMFAAEATGSAEEQWILKKVKIIFFTEDQSKYTVVGDLGEVDGKTKNILIRGQVITTSTNGYRFKTNDLNFDSASKSLKSDNSVEMNGPSDDGGSGFILNGVGFSINLKTNTMSILELVQAQKIISQKRFDITSNRAVFSNKNQEGHFHGQVKLKYDKTVIQAPEALFKYSHEQKKLKTILLRDQVNLKDLDRTATCRELELDLELDHMTLRGSPKVQMQDDIITGQEIIFTDGGQKVKINNVKVSGQIKDHK